MKAAFGGILFFFSIFRLPRVHAFARVAPEINFLRFTERFFPGFGVRRGSATFEKFHQL